MIVVEVVAERERNAEGGEMIGGGGRWDAVDSLCVG